MTITRRLLCCAFLATATTIASSPDVARAQGTFPTRPMHLLVPYAAGGGTDAIARLVAQGVGEKLGQSLVVENNGAAGGNVATQQAARADPDGYTILMANQGPMVVNPHLFANMKVDPLTAFDPVTLIAAAPLIVVVPQASSFKNLQELVECLDARRPWRLRRPSGPEAKRADWEVYNADSRGLALLQGAFGRPARGRLP
jgi:tripartite-type tricarboxylate transporter receptor subunit TctC